MKRHIPAVLALVATGGLLVGCVSTAPVGETTTVAVDSTADDCLVEPTTVESGTVTFRVTNSGDHISEFYLLGADGLSIVTEVEDIAPGSSRELSVIVQPGEYFTECKPGMIGAGVGTAAFTVTDAATDVDVDEE